MDDTPDLLLPYLQAAQAQKHVTHNEALRRLDAVVQLAALDRDLTAPPGAPNDGERYLVAAGATGDWAGHDDEIAAWQDGAWAFLAPNEGWLCWVADEDALLGWDGAAWAGTGGGDVRKQLAADRTYYVDGSNGSDGNDGLTDSTEFATIGKAIDTVAALDLSIYDVTIQVEDGTYDEQATVSAPWIGAGTVTLRGNDATPGNVSITRTGAGQSCVIANGPGAKLTVEHMDLVSSGTNGLGVHAVNGGNITYGEGLRFGACPQAHMRINGPGAAILAPGRTWTVIGDAARHIYCSPSGYFNGFNSEIVFSGTRAFTTFCFADRTAFVNAAGMTFSGDDASATGQRYNVNTLALIYTAGGGASFFPGDSAGTDNSGAGQYA